MGERCDWSLALTIGQAVSCGVIFALALRRGVGGVSALELGLLGIAALGIVGWQVADDPTVATCSVVVADLIGVALMLPKTYRDPAPRHSRRTRSVWCRRSAPWSRSIPPTSRCVIYPLYILIADSLVAGMIWLRRRALTCIVIGARHFRRVAACFVGS